MTNPQHPDLPPEAAPYPRRHSVRTVFELLDVLPTGVLLLDTEGIVLRINDTAERRLDRSANEVLGSDFFREVFPGLESEGIGARFRSEMAAGDAALEFERRLSGTVGDQRLWIGLRAFAVNGARIAVAVVEDRRALEESEERRKRAERLASVGELAASIAHEVNNPLASIQSFAQLLARDAATDEQRRALEIIIRESTRIAGVVDNLIRFARQQGVSDHEPVNISTIVREVLDQRQYALDAAGVEVRRDLDPNLSPVMGEAGALQQVVFNLVINAERALLSKQGRRLLIVRTRESSEGVVLSVVDNGPGIARDLLPHVFETAHHPGDRGTALELENSAALIREHSGQIWAESEQGRGAAFFVRLPRIQAPAAPRPEPPKPAPEEQSRPPLRVLIADDEPTLRAALTLFLERRGHAVTQAEDAYEAKRLVRDRVFDVALVDARMPGDGLDLLEFLETLPSLRGRTALMTGDLDRPRTSQSSATERPCLRKPFDMADAVRLIETLGR